MDIEKIMQFLPHRYPFLLVDRIVDFEAGHALTAIKNVTVNEPFFPGHFPHRPVMPGVMILEALAQASGILAFITVGEMPDEDMALYFVGIDKARFRRPVVPGDQLTLQTTFDRRIREIWRFQTEARVAEEVAVTATMMVATKGV
ncbi:MAG: 3-hydroxyacyl-ACP dehydratase FabZ [Gammaproteobacteria bacterium]|nr:MAG: 3-hydroxyacyl-ACP dehydratase FabZ [Gammaproteobacteria bacterium]